MSNLSRPSATISLISSAAFVAILVILHFLRPDLDPTWRFISEYELGPYGWMMQFAFLLLAMSCLSLGISLLPYTRNIPGCLGLFLITLSSVGMILAGVFVPDKVNRLHEVGAMLDNIPFAALFCLWSLSKHPLWKPAKRRLWLTSFLPLIGMIVFMGSLAYYLPKNGNEQGPAVLAGWPNRFFIITHILWLAPVADFARRIETFCVNKA